MDQIISWFLTFTFAYFFTLCYYFIEFKWPELEHKIEQLQAENERLRSGKP